MVGIINLTTNISIENIINVTNVSKVPDLLININNNIFGGWYYFIMLFVAWIILFIAAQKLENLPLQNAMYSGAIVTVISLFLRAIYIVKDGVVLGLLSDYQFWIFPLITIILAAIAWGTKE